MHDWAVRRKARPKRFGLLWMVIIIAALVWLLRLMDGDWKLFDILDDVPFFEFASYVDAIGGQAELGFLYGTITSVGLATYVVNILKKYAIGEQNASILKPIGFLFWIMNIYILALCSAVIKPLQDWYSVNDPGVSYQTMMPNFPTGVLGILAMAAMYYTISETVKTTLGVYFSIPCFYLFTNLKLNYVVLFLFLGFDHLTGVAWFEDSLKVQCVALAFLTQLFIDFLYWIGILKLALVILKKLFLSLPFMFPSLIAVIVGCSYLKYRYGG